MKMYSPNTGDIVKVVRKDGKTYECFVIEQVKRGKLFFGRVLNKSEGVSTTTWHRYQLDGNCICQPVSECKSVELLSRAHQRITEDQSRSIKIYTNKIPGTQKMLTFCLDEDYGGWSENPDEEEALVESYSKAFSLKESRRMCQYDK